MVEDGQAQRANTTFHLYRTQLIGPVKIGALELTDVDVVVSDQATEINIGSGVLQHAVVRIDQRAQLLSVRPSDQQEQALREALAME
ncbi:MAG: hypothetical protein HC888_15805 [Candidatus Competibacteraceae bacterium]|nr:hypothetical protein [Candidatus Competibacteraceae bacterium]